MTIDVPEPSGTHAEILVKVEEIRKLLAVLDANPSNPATPEHLRLRLGDVFERGFLQVETVIQHDWKHRYFEVSSWSTVMNIGPDPSVPPP
jgi:hypothetical protein